MDLILFNTQWMSFNIFLAILPVVFGYLMVRVPSRVLKLFFGASWVIFLPNTLYLLTDIMHFFIDWHRVAPLYQPLFILEYLVLIVCGVITFILALLPIDRILRVGKGKKAKRREWFVYAFNFLIGFGIVLGRIERLNSWEVVTNTSKVVYQSMQTLTSLNLMLLVIFFGLFCNLIYFSCKDFLTKKLSNFS